MTRFLFIALAVGTLAPQVSAAMALLVGVGFALVWGNPFIDRTRAMTQRLLTTSVMGLGAGMNLAVVGEVGFRGIGYTMSGIVAAFVLGTLLGKLLGTERDTSLLISTGTAICGGSAIAAVAPVIQAKAHEVSIALGIVFMLNALALLIFPWAGHLLHLSEAQFGLWAALAIHDTSSVVGATSQYGAHALEIGTTVKLARALWIVPVALTIGFLRARGARSQRTPQKVKLPWFILGFLVAAAIVTWVPVLKPAGHVIESIARRSLVLTLFLIGANLNRTTLQSVGLKPFIQGIMLWLMVACGTLGAILGGVIHD